MQGASAIAQFSKDGLLEMLREREVQARNFRATYLASVPDENSMLYWLAQAAAQARTYAGRKQVHVAASLDKDQSTITRFEQGERWPRNADEVVGAYADDLDVDPIQLWEEALRLWKDHRAATAPEVAAAVEEEAARHSARRARSAASTPPSRRSAAA
jgi:hypothetical protein